MRPARAADNMKFAAIASHGIDPLRIGRPDCGVVIVVYPFCYVFRLGHKGLFDCWENFLLVPIPDIHPCSF